jgi:uncharacterized protein YkwD
MRKPLVVVCAAASALLLTGGVAATSANADERPDRPGWSGFSLPGWPFFGGSGSDSYEEEPDRPSSDSTVDDDDNSADYSDNSDSGDDDSDRWRDNSDDSDSVRAQDPNGARPDFAPGPGHEQPGFAMNQRPGQQQVERPAAHDQQDQARGQQDQAQRTAAQHAAAQRAAAQRAAAQAGGAQRGGAHRDAARRPQIQRPQVQRQQVQRNASIADAARRAVTVGDVSASPAAPVQQRVLALVNQNRRRAGCGPLSVDRRLIEAANRHAADMARRDYFEHESPNGDSAGDRVSRTGYDWKRYGENIARGADSAWEVVDGWMHSRVHRENILDCGLRQQGIGLAIARDRTTYWVQDFATPSN